MSELLTDLVAKWAVATPDSLAIGYGDQEFTWVQWFERIRRLAGALTGAGIGRGDRVAFLDKNHSACLETMIAAAMLGAATAIINWRLVSDELAYVLDDCGARVAFVGAEFVDAVTTLRSSLTGLERVIVVGGEVNPYECFLAEGELADSAPDVIERDDALIVYSSGTTGRPKGVVLSQRALVAHTVNAGAAFGYADGDKNFVAMPLFHVGGICFAFFGIRAGVQTIIGRDTEVALLAEAISDGVTHTFLVPPVIASFLAAGREAVAAMSRLRYLAYGAAPMPRPLLRRALRAWPSLNFVQVFGQTELCGAVTTLAPEDHRDLQRQHLLVSVGRPVAGCEIRIVDIESDDVAKIGELGEIWVRTDQRMTRYLNKLDATVETITDDGWVRTGDIGRVDKAGYVYVEDRLKDLIITGGENVYGPEVERVLMGHPAIADAAVIGVPDDRWGESVKAIVVTDHDDLRAEDVIAFCRLRIAGYKCPRTIDFVAALPRNASGKILKRELRNPYWKLHDRAV